MFKDSGPVGEFEVLAHLYKKQSTHFLQNKYSVMVFDAKSEALISQRIAIKLTRKGNTLFLNKTRISKNIIDFLTNMLGFVYYASKLAEVTE